MRSASRPPSIEGAVRMVESQLTALSRLSGIKLACLEAAFGVHSYRLERRQMGAKQPLWRILTIDIPVLFPKRETLPQAAKRLLDIAPRSLTALFVGEGLSGLRNGRPKPVKGTACADAVSLKDCLVRSRRLELPRPCGHNDLNVARLPVPPRPHMIEGAHCGPRVGRSAPLAGGFRGRKRFGCARCKPAWKRRT